MNTLTHAKLSIRTKSFPAKPLGMLQLNEVPQGPWQIITSDLIVGLPRSGSYDALLVTSNRFTKQVYITACHKTATAEDTAALYIRDVFKHYGTPQQLITDRGPQFASKCLHAIYKSLGIKPTMSTAFHPQTDGQTEHWNQEIEQYLQAFINYRQTDWAKHLLVAEFALNNWVHSAKGHSPLLSSIWLPPTITLWHQSIHNNPSHQQMNRGTPQSTRRCTSHTEIISRKDENFLWQ